MKILKRAVHRFEVFLDDGFATLAIGLLNGMLNLCNGRFAGQDTADGKEGCLHDGVHPPTHAGFFSDFIAVDDVELEIFPKNVLLYFTWKLIPDSLGTVQAVQEED